MSHNEGGYAKKFAYLEPEKVRSFQRLTFSAAKDTAVRMKGYVRVSKIKRTKPYICIPDWYLKKSGSSWRIKQEFSLKAKRVISLNMIVELSDHLEKVVLILLLIFYKEKKDAKNNIYISFGNAL